MYDDQVLLTLGRPLAGWLPTVTAVTAGTPAGIHLRRSAFAVWHDHVRGDGPPPRLGPSRNAPQRDAAAELASASGACSGLDPRLRSTAEFLAKRLPRAARPIFVQSPAEALAPSLKAEVAGLPRCRTADVDGPYSGLLLAHRGPECCLLVDAIEALRHGAALALLQNG